MSKSIEIFFLYFVGAKIIAILIFLILNFNTYFVLNFNLLKKKLNTYFILNFSIYLIQNSKASFI